MPDHSTADITIIIPAHNETGYIQACLTALLAQDDTAGHMHVIVAANACTDNTVALATACADDFAARGCTLTVLDRPEGGKVGALNAAEAGLTPGPRIYLDADVVCDPALIGQIRAALDTDQPRYATGRLAVAPAHSWVTRLYARVWQALPFFQGGAVGAGFFAVNAAGRARWDAFPTIISDDTFVRLNFAPEERKEVAARYHWPMIEGFNGLVRVRRRQDDGVNEVRRDYPELMANDTTPPLGLRGMAKLALRQPLGFGVYVAVHLAVRIKRPATAWDRGR